MVSLVGFAIILAVLGCIFALPALIPAFRRRAIESSSYRRMLIAVLSIITFFVFFFGVSFGAIIATKTFYYIGSCDFNTDSCSFNPFEDDPQRDRLLTQELWLQYILPPIFISDDTCLTGDAIVCQEANEIRPYTGADTSLVEYIFLIIYLAIPAISCGLMVRYITRDDRKRKRDMSSSAEI